METDKIQQTRKPRKNYSETQTGDEIKQYFLKVCRCCLSEKNNLQSIHTNEGCIAKLITELCDIQIFTNDALPEQICTQCSVQVKKALTFKRQIETVDGTLRNYLNNKNMEFTVADLLSPKSDQTDTTDTEKQIDTHHFMSNQTPANEFHEFFDNNEEFDEYAEFEENEYPGKDQIKETPPKCNVNDDGDEDNKKDIKKCEILPETTEQSIKITNKKQKLKYSEEDKNIKKKSNKSDEIKSTKIQKSSNGSLICNICKKIFSDARRLNRHKKIHFNVKPYICATCNKGFVERTDLNRHVARHNRLQEDNMNHSYNCSDCLAGFSNERDLRIHSSVHGKNGQLICAECSKEFLSTIQIKRHVRTHFTDKPHKCRICLKGFAEMGSLTRHFRRHTGEQRERKHSCKYCGKRYYDTYSLNVHIRNHTGEKPWICTVCGKGFIDSRLLNSHLKVHSDKKPFACDVCDKRFTHQSTLTTHARTHTGEKPYVCSVCGKTFIQSSNLSLHMRVHSGEKPYKCYECNRSFASSSTLTMHMRIHTGEKPFTCELCNKRFARHDLTAHMRTHTGEKPYECGQCKKKFTTSGQLNQHSRTHTGEKPYVCNICNKACSSSSYLKKHKRIHMIAIDTPHNGIGEQIQLNRDTINENLERHYKEEESIAIGYQDELLSDSFETSKTIHANDINLPANINFDTKHYALQADDDLNNHETMIEILPGIENESYVAVDETHYVRIVNGEPTEVIESIQDIN